MGFPLNSQMIFNIEKQKYMENEEVRLIDTLLLVEDTIETTEENLEASVSGWAYDLEICDETDNVF